MKDDHIIQAQGLSKVFGPTTALKSVSLETGRGEIFGLIGSDGAGKTTLIRILATVMAPSQGHARIAGWDTQRDRRQIKHLIGYMPQQFGFYGDLTVLENMCFFSDVYGIPKKEQAPRFRRFLGFSGLLPFGDRLARNLSGGMKQKLGLAAVLVHLPEILILDEPTNGVDPVSRQEFWDILREMKSQGLSIFVSTSYLDEAEFCDRVALLHQGRLLAVDTPEVLRGPHETVEQAVIERIGGTNE